MPSSTEHRLVNLYYYCLLQGHTVRPPWCAVLQGKRLSLCSVAQQGMVQGSNREYKGPVGITGWQPAQSGQGYTGRSPKATVPDGVIHWRLAVSCRLPALMYAVVKAVL